MLSFEHKKSRFHGLFLLKFCDFVDIHGKASRLYYVLFFLPILMLFCASGFEHTLFHCDMLMRGFVNDYPALWLTAIGFSALCVLFSRYADVISSLGLSMNFKGVFNKDSKKMMDYNYDNISKYKCICISIIFLCASFYINHFWVKSQLNDGVYTWFSINGFWKPIWMNSSVELFNLGGLIYFVVCILYWYLFLTLTYLFLYSLVGFFITYFIDSSLEIFKFGNPGTRCYLINTSNFIFLFLFYFFTLEFNDLYIEGYQTFIIHSERLKMFVVAVFLLVFYSYLISFILSFRENNKNHNEMSLKNQESKAFFTRFRYGFNFFFGSMLVFIVTVYSISISYLFANRSYEFKLGYTFFIFLFISILAVIIHLFNYKRAVFMSSIFDENKYLASYANSIEEIYQGSRQYKHDIQNMLLGMKLIVDEGSLLEIREYFYNDILGNSPYEKNNYNVFSQLYMIENLTIKGLLLIKFESMLADDIVLDIEILDSFNVLSIENVEFCRLMGILLDNAFESAKKSDSKRVLFSVNQESNWLKFTIGNSYSKGADFDKIFDINYSTKGDNRGLGLYYLKKVVSNSVNLDLSTQINKEWFIQEFTIKI